MSVSLDAYRSCSTPEEFLAVAGGDHRTAEQAAWELHALYGSPKGGHYAMMAVAIDDLRFAHRRQPA